MNSFGVLSVGANNLGIILKVMQWGTKYKKYMQVALLSITHVMPILFRPNGACYSVSKLVSATRLSVRRRSLKITVATSLCEHTNNRI